MHIVLILKMLNEKLHTCNYKHLLVVYALPNTYSAQHITIFWL